MINIYEYLLSKKNQKINMIHATDANVHDIVKNELDKLGHDADLNHIDVSEVTNMNNLFNCCPMEMIRANLSQKYKDLNLDISQWDVSNVKSMYAMFYGFENFNCDISNWNVKSVKNMCYMFYDCKTFNQDISNWNVGEVENMINMFKKCKNFNKDISNWNVSNVKNYGIFNDCPIKEEYKPKFK